MSLAAPSAENRAGQVTKRMRRVLAIHFDADQGTPFWLERERSLGLDAREDIRTIGDLPQLGTMAPADLSGRPLRDFVPRRFHADMAGWILGQTGGTTGGGVWTAYRPDEFAEAFITPFTRAATHVGFPVGEHWLYVGPSGPHVIGKVVRELAASMGGHDPFSVDFDARWAKKLPEGSFAMERYLSHVIDQAMGIIGSQEIGVIFTTPVVLSALAGAMAPEQRLRIRGLHYGGMEVTPATLASMQTQHFPNAVHLSGYGNTLFGCCLELDVSPRRSPEYFPLGARLVLEVVDPQGHSTSPGEEGAVCFTRLDESCLIVRMRERDAATLVRPPENAPPGFLLPGVRTPHSPLSLAPQQAKGLY